MANSSHIPQKLQPQRSIISVKEARKLLGKSAKAKSDDDIKAMVRDYEALARHTIREYLVRK